MDCRRFLLDQLRQGSRALGLAVQGIGDEPANIAEPERRKHDLMHPRIRLADRLERAREWM